MIPQALACIHTDALRHNLKQVRKYAPDTKVLAVVKADAYGHNLGIIFNALADADALAVGTIDEAELLGVINDSMPVVILQGIDDRESLLRCMEKGFQVVVHSEYQVEILESISVQRSIDVWLKMDTGMHRLGLPLEKYKSVCQRLSGLSHVRSITLMSHLACADEPQRNENAEQLQRFSDMAAQHQGEKSLCNSAGLIGLQKGHYDWVRPGIMLYGISPITGRAADELALKPVMTLKSRLIAINNWRRGDKIGYGGTWECPEDMPVGVVGIGYGDGYPRHVPSGTPVLIHGQRVPLIGRVSMDLLTIDLRTLPQASIGDEVTLWGEGLPIEEIADAAGTIGYELVCRLTSRVVYEGVT